MFISRLLGLWDQFGLARPGCPILIFAPNSQIFAVIDDTEDRFRLMDKYGNVVILDPKKCSVKEGSYVCDGELILIDTRFNPRDRFVFDYILPEVFTSNVSL